MSPEILKPLFTLGMLALGFFAGRVLMLAGQLQARFGYSWREAFADAFRLLFDTSL